MKHIKAFEYNYNRYGDKYDVGDIVICVDSKYSKQLVLNRKYKVEDIKGGDHGLFFVDVKDMETGRGIVGCDAHKFKTQREIDTNKYNL